MKDKKFHQRDMVSERLYHTVNDFNSVELGKDYYLGKNEELRRFKILGYSKN